MRIVYVVTFSVFPTNSGAAVRALGIWRALQKLGEVQLVIFGDRPDADARTQLRKAGAWIYPARRETSFQRLTRCLWAWMTGASIPAARYLSARRIARFTKRVRDFRPNLVVLDDTYLSTLLPAMREAAPHVVVGTYNVESLLWSRLSSNARRLGEKFAYRILARNARWLEMEMLPHADQVWAPSELDAAIYRRDFGLTNACVVPTVLDMTQYNPSPDHEDRLILFTGTYNYPPNEEAALFLIECAKSMRSLGIEYRLALVGRAPTQRMRDAVHGQPQIEITGPVPEVLPWFERADIFAAPLLSGSGTKIKLMEAAAMSKAILTTPVGAEGLDMVSRENCRIAEPAGFCDALRSLLSATEERTRIGAAARRWAVEKHSQEVADQRVSDLVSRLDRP